MRFPSFPTLLIQLGFATGLLLYATLASAEEPVSLMFGDPAERHVEIVFGADRSGPEALVITTRRVGNPGARLSISIDRSQNWILRRILTEDDCSFDNLGATCRVTVAGDTAKYNAFVIGFARAKTAHVAVENAATMEMSDDIDLDGFRAAYGPEAAARGA
ncbi:MAG: hypothetical protein AAF919_00715 [Pseudomonadota bacterium]